jgi:hypothetical protein
MKGENVLNPEIDKVLKCAKKHGKNIFLFKAFNN